MPQNKKLRQSYEELQSTVMSLQTSLATVQQAYSSMSEVLAAVVSLLGETSVQSEMERLRQERQDAQEAQMAAGVKLLVDERVLKPVAETALNALVVGTDLNPDGKTRRVQFELKEQVVPAEILPKFIGKKPGDIVENNGVKLTIVEVYEIDKARAAEFQVEQQKKAQEAALAAAAPVEGGPGTAPADPLGEPTEEDLAKLPPDAPAQPHLVVP